MKMKVLQVFAIISSLVLYVCFAQVAASDLRSICHDSMVSTHAAVSPDGMMFAAIGRSAGEDRLYLYDSGNGSQRTVNAAELDIGGIETICWMNNSELLLGYRQKMPVRGLGTISELGLKIPYFARFTRDGRMAGKFVIPLSDH